jgi:multiple sugar transport system permease protein
MISTPSIPGRIAKVAFLALWLAITVFPLYWIVISALKSPASLYRFPLQYWPADFSLANFQSLFSASNFGAYIGNSLLAAFVSATVVTVISLLSAYVIARFEFRSKGAVVMAFLATQMIPGFIALGPLYQLMTSLGLVDNRAGLILVYVAMCIPFSTIMLRGFFENVPDALEEAAMIDGCSRLTALFRVLVPVMLPGITAAFIFNFVNCWNELFLSVTLLNTNEKMTIPGALNGFITSYNIDWGPMSAAAVLAAVPTLVMFAFASKYIVQGLTSGAVKG